MQAPDGRGMTLAVRETMLSVRGQKSNDPCQVDERRWDIGHRWALQYHSAFANYRSRFPTWQVAPYPSSSLTSSAVFGRASWRTDR